MNKLSNLFSENNVQYNDRILRILRVISAGVKHEILTDWILRILKTILLHPHIFRHQVGGYY